MMNIVWKPNIIVNCNSRKEMQMKKDFSNRIDELEEEVSKLRVQLEALELRNNDNNRKNNNKIEIGD